MEEVEEVIKDIKDENVKSNYDDFDLDSYSNFFHFINHYNSSEKYDYNYLYSFKIFQEKKGKISCIYHTSKSTRIGKCNIKIVSLPF